jgi:hypothetical protein
MGRICIAFCLLAGLLHAQGAAPAKKPVDDAFHAEVVKLYDFVVGSLPQKQMEAKSAELDAFWKKVKAKPATYAPSLRRELAREDAPKFFLFDGSLLLLNLSTGDDGKKPADKGDARIAIDSLSRCTLKGIQPSEYLRRVHDLSSQGHDTTAAALHILDEPSFQAFIASHALTLGQDDSLVVMLTPIDEALWLKAALERLKTEKDATACKSLLKLIWYAATDEGDKAILDFAQDKTQPEELRMAAGQLGVQSMAIPMKYTGDERAKVAKALAVKVDSSVPDLRAARRKRMRDPISDEALGDLDQFTILIRSHAP